MAKLKFRQLGRLVKSSSQQFKRKRSNRTTINSRINQNQYIRRSKKRDIPTKKVKLNGSKSVSQRLVEPNKLKKAL